MWMKIKRKKKCKKMMQRMTQRKDAKKTKKIFVHNAGEKILYQNTKMALYHGGDVTKN
jgi:transcriptional regulator NrdR family protein